MKLRKVGYERWECCPLCKGQGQAAGVLDRGTYRFGPLQIPYPDEPLRVAACRACGLVFKTLVPALADMRAVLAEAGSLVWRPRPRPYDQERALLLRVAPRKDRVDLLDVGAGGGDMLRCLGGVPGRRSALDAYRDPACAASVDGEYILGLLEEDHLAWSGRPYDVVTAFDLVEHALRPREAMERLATFVAPGGALIVQTGDPGYPTSRGRSLGAWWYLQLFEHHLAWPPETLRRAGEAQGLRLEHLEASMHKERAHLPAWKRLAIRGLRRAAASEGAGRALSGLLGRDVATLAEPDARDHYTMVLRRP